MIDNLYKLKCLKEEETDELIAEGGAVAKC